MKREKIKNTKWRIPKTVFKIFSFFILILYIQLVYLSISNKIYGQNMSNFASSRNTVKQVTKANRGTIFDINNEPLALNVSSYTLFAYLDPARSKNQIKPLHVEDVELTAEKLSSVLGKDKEYFKNILEKGIENKRKQVEFGTIGKGITELVKEQIEALELPGISFMETKKRYYPNGNFASYIVGYAKEKEVTYKDDNGDKVTKNEITGELGIESEYNDILKGKDGYLEYQQDRYGYKIVGTKEINEEAKDGYNVYLTIDSNIQRFVESALAKSYKDYSPELMMLTVMDATNGDILATSTLPSFDPNIRDIKNYENSLVSYTYEPGSTMKVYTYMCAIDNNVYNGEKTFNSGSFKIGDDTIRDWNIKGWGTINYDKGFEYSSNVGIANMLKNNLNKNQLRDCYNKFGFGKITDIELNRERAGKISFNYPIEVATAGFGQGISTTAMQQLQALTIISNNGKMLKPHIVDRIINPNNNEIYYESKKQESKQLVKQETVSKIKDLMYNVVNGTDSATTGKVYKIDDFDIIGKTGTAEISEKGKYLENQYIYSFAGMYPKNNPKYIIYGMLKKPKGNTSKGLSNAITDTILSISKYEKIDTENKEEKKEFIIKSYLSKKTNDVIKELEDKKIEVIKLGNGDKVIKQYPKSSTKITSKDKIILLTNDNDIKMPNFENLSKKDAKIILDLLDIKYEFEGYGFIYEQSIKTGEKINKKDKIKFKLKSKYFSEEGENDE